MVPSQFVLGLAAIVQFLGATQAATRFFPGSGGVQNTYFDTPLPKRWDIYNSNSPQLPNGTDSWWTSSYLTDNDGDEYVLISHVINTGGTGYYRGSINGVTNTSYYEQYMQMIDTSFIYHGNYSTQFGIATADYYFGAATENLNGPIRTYSAHEGLEWDITFDYSCPILLNAGIGTFVLGGADATEWGLPAARTTGFIVVNGKNISVNPEASLTWYDRQWGPLPSGSAGPGNWTWFQLHLNGRPGYTGSKWSIWFMQDGSGEMNSLASYSETPGTSSVVAATRFDVFGNVWTGPDNYNYAQNWHVELTDGTRLDISSIKDDQLLITKEGTGSTYEGFVNVRGSYRDGRKIEGYGLAEIMPPSPLAA